MNRLTRMSWMWLALAAVVAGCAGPGIEADMPILRNHNGAWDRMKLCRPRRYVAGRAQGKMVIDGKADEPSWQQARWTQYFADIEGDLKPKPRFRTRAKMLWDDEYFYFYAELEEPHVWATLTKKNSRIYDDNDFEIFMDPDGDNHNYYEFEMNALNTIWELALTRPYWDGGPLRNPENIDGTLSGVHVRGTLNDPRDKDEGWSVEIAIPFKGLARYAGERACPPNDGDQWRVGFSRVTWNMRIVNGKYAKVPNQRENNWVWSPVGIVSMHRPERWGYVQFSTAAPGQARFRPDPAEGAREILMEIYHRQRDYRGRFKRFASTPEQLGLPSDYGKTWMSSAVSIRLTKTGFVATITIKAPGARPKALHVRQDSRLWSD